MKKLKKRKPKSKRIGIQYSHSHKSRPLTWTDNDDVMTIERIFLSFVFTSCHFCFFLAFTHSRTVCGLQSQSAFCTRIPSSLSYLPTDRTKKVGDRETRWRYIKWILWSIFIFYFTSFQPMESNRTTYYYSILCFSRFCFNMQQNVRSIWAVPYQSHKNHCNTFFLSDIIHHD